MLDSLLDRTVVLGYSRVGYALRSRSWPQEETRLRGRDVLLTGGSSGIGRNAVALLAARGARVHVVGRNSVRLDEVAREVRDRTPGAVVETWRCDVSDLADVRRFAGEFRSQVAGLRALLHNAGTMVPQRTETDQGHEATLATHVLGPHLLTALLTDALAADGAGRVVFHSSGGMYGAPLHSDDPEYRHGSYSPVMAYARTKRMQVVLARLWAERLRDRGIAVHSCHPGWVDTPGVREHLPRFHTVTRLVLRPLDQGADTLVWLADGPNRIEHTGAFWHDRRVRPTTLLRPAGDSTARRQALWDYCVEATGEPAPR